MLDCYKSKNDNLYHRSAGYISLCQKSYFIYPLFPKEHNIMGFLRKLL